MNHLLEKVEEFHKVFGAPTGPGNGSLALDRKQLRIKLIFEELKELAEAMGVEGTFFELCADAVIENCKKDPDNWSRDNNWIDPVATLDAECDLQVVLSGTIIENGHAEIFDEAFAEVHRSNMSKSLIIPDLGTGLDVAQKRANNHVKKLEEEKGVPVILAGHWGDASPKGINDPSRFIFLRESDKKVLKGPDFKEPRLEQFLNDKDDEESEESE